MSDNKKDTGNSKVLFKDGALIPKMPPAGGTEHEKHGAPIPDLPPVTKPGQSKPIQQPNTEKPTPPKPKK